MITSRHVALDAGARALPDRHLAKSARGICRRVERPTGVRAARRRRCLATRQNSCLGRRTAGPAIVGHVDRCSVATCLSNLALDSASARRVSIASFTHDG
jgi:hypothetical protein